MGRHGVRTDLPSQAVGAVPHARQVLRPGKRAEDLHALGVVQVVLQDAHMVLEHPPVDAAVGIAQALRPVKASPGSRVVLRHRLARSLVETGKDQLLGQPVLDPRGVVAGLPDLLIGQRHDPGPVGVGRAHSRFSSARSA